MPNFSDIKDFFRQQENAHHYKPAKIYKQMQGNEEYISISFTKTAFYAQNEEGDNWAWFQASGHLNTDAHARGIKSQLETEYEIKSPVVEVSRRNKTLPIPFISIPIPFWKRGPQAVRDNSTVATQDVWVSIKVKTKDITNPELLWNAVNDAAVYTHICDKNGNHYKAAQRLSRNPIKLLGRLFSWLTSFITPNALATMPIPNFIRSAFRRSEYGYDAANIIIDPPAIRSGLLANCISAVVTAVVIWYTWWVFVAICCLGGGGGSSGGDGCGSIVYFGGGNIDIGSSEQPKPIAGSANVSSDPASTKVARDLKRSTFTPFLQNDNKISDTEPLVRLGKPGVHISYNNMHQSKSQQGTGAAQPLITNSYTNS